MNLKQISLPTNQMVSLLALKKAVNEKLISLSQPPLSDLDWYDIAANVPPSVDHSPAKPPQTPTNQPIKTELVSPKNWRKKYCDKKIPGKTIRDRAYEFMKRIIENPDHSAEYETLMQHQADLKDQLKSDIMTKEEDGDHEFLERQFIIDALKRDQALKAQRNHYPRDKGWLEIQRTLRSKTQTILFKGNPPDRNRLDGGHRFAMFSSGATEVLGIMPGDHRTKNHAFHLALEQAFTRSTTRKGFIRRVRNIARQYIHPGDQPLTLIRPKNLIFGKTLETDNPNHLAQAQQHLAIAYQHREKMFQKWEDELASGSESEDGLEALVDT